METEKKTAKLQLKHKIVIAMSLVVALPLIIVGVYSSHTHSQALEENRLRSMEFETEQIASTIKIMLHNFIDDTMFLGEVPPIQGIIRARDNNNHDVLGNSSYEQWINRLNSIFIEFSEIKKHYAQLRYINEHGEEMVRVNYNKLRASIADPSKLQNKSQRDYFTKTMQSEKGSVYISDMELNIENGVIQQPAQLVIRFSIPIFDTQGKRRGIVVLNAFGERVTDILKVSNKQVAGNFYLAAKNGDYLFHPNLEKTVLNGNAGPDNLFKDSPEFPHPSRSSANSGHIANLDEHAVAYAFLSPDPYRPSNRWTLAYSWSLQDMQAPIKHYQRIFFSVFIVSLLVAVSWGAWLGRVWLLNPLNRLGHALDKFRQGEFESRIVITRDDEIGRIGNLYNDMAQQLQERSVREQQQMTELKEAANIKEQVNGISECLNKVALGDLTQRVVVSGNKEMRKLGEDLNETIEALSVLTKGMIEAGTDMTTTLNEIQQNIASQSSAAAEQAAAVNQTTSALEEIRAISAQTQEKAQALGSSAQRTESEGEKGMQVVEQTIAGMNSIREKVAGIANNIMALSEQTQQIGEITDTVNNLSHQLKMLALNASIEAAKAGEAGKGFAVVAWEVKDLAEQSQQATEQVHKILQDIQHATDKAVMVTEEGGKGVAQGMTLVTQSGDAVRELTRIIRETAMASQQIVVSVRQEAAGIDQIFSAMNEINNATSQFVNTTSQTRAAVNNLDGIAQHLHLNAKTYKV